MAEPVVVLGAGIIGLLTAKALQDHGEQVILLSDSTPLASASAAAGAIILPFFPFAPGSTEFARRMRWTQTSLGLVETYDAGSYASTVEHVEFCRDGLLEGSFPIEWLPETGLRDAVIVDLEEMFQGHQQFVRFALTCVDSLSFLERLGREFLDRGGTYHRTRIDAPTIRALPADYVFNCLGYGSGAVFDDPELVPVFGQTIRLPPTDVHFGVGIGEFIALSTRYCRYIGSLFIPNEEREVPRRVHHERLVDFAEQLLPEILDLIDLDGGLGSLDDMVEARAGVRPWRPAGVRLEVEETLGKKVVHNYGHGAHGWTLGWGSVVEAVELWRQATEG